MSEGILRLSTAADRRTLNFYWEMIVQYVICGHIAQSFFYAGAVIGRYC